MSWRKGERVEGEREGVRERREGKGMCSKRKEGYEIRG